MWLLVGGCMAMVVGLVLDACRVGYDTPLPILGSAAITIFFLFVGAAAGAALSGALE